MKTDKAKIAVIGGNGKAGQFIVKYCIENSIHLKLLLRSPEQFELKNELIEVIEGDARDQDAVRKLVNGSVCVINAIGAKKGDGVYFETVTRNIFQVMTEHSIMRYILLTGIGIDAEGDRKTFSVKFQSRILKSLFPDVMKGKQSDFDYLKGLPLDWTVIRIPYLNRNGSSSGVKVNLHSPEGKFVYGANLAEFIIGQVNCRDYLHKAPFVSS